MGWLHIAVLVFKILNDCVGKSLLAFAFIYSTGAGRFSTIRTLATFYSIAAIMMLFHTIFNKVPTRELCSVRHWIGENGFNFNIRLLTSFLNFATGVLMNSLSSVLTYTDMDLAAILGKERSGARHQSSLGKQVVYFFIVLFIQIG